MRWPGSSPQARSASACSSRPAIPARRNAARISRSTSPITRRSRRLPAPKGSISSSSARRRRSSPASSTISRRRASRRSGRAAAAAAARRLEGVHQGALRRGRHPDGALPALHRPGGGAGLCAGRGRADRRQGRRACGRQGRRRRGERRRGGARDRRHARRRARRGRGRARDRGVPRRRGGEPVRALRRHDRGPARHRPGPQARLRRRPRARTPAAWAPTRRPRC